LPRKIREPPFDRAIPVAAVCKIKNTREDVIVINRLLRCAFTGVGLLLVAPLTQVHAQSPAKTITLVVPYAAGGGTDTVARLIGERMSRTLGQAVIIENQVGGGSTLANDRVARSAPDGTTILINHVALLAAPGA